MRDLFLYEKRATYPHMSAADTAIWNAFLDKYPDEFKEVQYDFMVGDPPPFNTLMDDDTDKNQDMLYRLRIDVIGHTNNDINIIEIKPSAGASVIGQVKGYKTLYIRDEEPKKPVNMIIITDRLKTNMDYLCKAENIKLVVI